MKAITLRQPWASLVAAGAKKIETRSWPTKYRGELLIHAGKALDDVHRAMRGDGDPHGRVEVALAERGYCLEPWAEGPEPWLPLPLGAVVASCRLVDCVPIVEDDADMPVGSAEGYIATNEKRLSRNDPELWRPARISVNGAEPFDGWRRVRTFYDQQPFGDFSPGRYAWLLEDVKATTERCPRCWGHPEWPTDHRIEGGSLSCRYCNRTFTFNFMRDRGPHRCSCEGARRAACPVCLTADRVAPVPMRGHQGLWTPTWPSPDGGLDT